MIPDRPPRRYSLDPDPDSVCPPPAWVAETVELARRLGLHREQREAIRRLLAETEIGELELPQMLHAGTRPDSKMALWWAKDGWPAQVELHHTRGGWRAQVCLFHGEFPVVVERPKHPANLLRSMLGRVFPAG